MSHITKIDLSGLRAFDRWRILDRRTSPAMRFHPTTSQWLTGAAPVASVSPRDTRRVGLRLPVLGFIADGNHVSALARRAMR
jgi:hypothetical protein